MVEVVASFNFAGKGDEGVAVFSSSFLTGLNEFVASL